MIAYHLSPESSIRKLDLQHLEMGLGTSFYGAGIYLTFDYDVIEMYLKQIKQRPMYIYTVEISENGIFNEFDTVAATKQSALGTYANFVEELQDEVKATQKIVKLGVNAIEYNSPEDKHSIVVYNPSILKIVSKQEVLV